MGVRRSSNGVLEVPPAVVQANLPGQPQNDPLQQLVDTAQQLSSVFSGRGLSLPTIPVGANGQVDVEKIAIDAVKNGIKQGIEYLTSPERQAELKAQEEKAKQEAETAKKKEEDERQKREQEMAKRLESSVSIDKTMAHGAITSADVDRLKRMLQEGKVPSNSVEQVSASIRYIEELQQHRERVAEKEKDGDKHKDKSKERRSLLARGDDREDRDRTTTRRGEARGEKKGGDAAA